ncbi:unnamed protein product [Phytophthora fragariaefolia]|uniref:Unnamed protein product n=1 Tax=Phytophthora fragariaefolia TaxID=1490495 RepID=A0A9W6YLI0_9STRA|nr:unnamed protein product [Phytophthora fragariaefolia]
MIAVQQSEGHTGILPVYRSWSRRLLDNIFSYGFTSQKPQDTKMPTSELMQTRAEFSIDMWGKYATWCPTKILNMVETAINFDIPPTRFWAAKGRKDPARIVNLTKHAGRMTAVLTIRADGTFLTI